MPRLLICTIWFWRWRTAPRQSISVAVKWDSAKSVSVKTVLYWSTGSGWYFMVWTGMTIARSMVVRSPGKKWKMIFVWWRGWISMQSALPIILIIHIFMSCAINMEFMYWRRPMWSAMVIWVFPMWNSLRNRWSNVPRTMWNGYGIMSLFLCGPMAMNPETVQISNLWKRRLRAWIILVWLITRVIVSGVM